MAKAVRVVICALALACALVGCASHAEKMAPFWNAYRANDFAKADNLINQQLSDEFDLNDNQWQALSSSLLALSFQPKDPEQALLLLEKAMVMLAKGDAKSAEALLQDARMAYDKVYLKSSLKTIAENVGAALSDDTALSYDPAPYEHIMLRCCLLIADLLNGGQDAIAYSNQIDEAQRQIFNFQYEGGGRTFKPYENYKRVGFGSYMRGVMLEGDLKQSSALLAYQQFQQYEPTLPYAAKTVERVEAGEYAPPGYGVVHVLYLGGAGPTLRTVNHQATQDALVIASVIGAMASDTWSPLAQSAGSKVPVPQVQINTPYVPPLTVSASGKRVSTALVLDVNRLATQHLASQLDYIIARVIVRRVLKATASAVAERSAQKAGGDAAQIAAVVLGWLWTAAEQADTRIWGTLPAQIQTARLPLPEGDHTLRIGRGGEAKVRVAAGYDSFVVVVRPNLSLPAAISVDSHSRVVESDKR